MKSKLLPKRATVIENRRETPDIFSLIIDHRSDYDPGQFVEVSVFGYGECPISIASYTPDYMRLTIREIGAVTEALGKLREGDPIHIRGPYGRGFPMKDFEDQNLIILGAGCGVAALRGIIDYLETKRRAYNDVFLFFGYRHANDILFKEQVAEWKNRYNIKIALSKENPKTCFEWNTGHITDVIKGLKLRSQNTGVFICGPPRMMHDSVGILRERGFSDQQIFVATERLMYCGVGMCCHCMIRGKFTCLDGPVFRFDEIGYYQND